MLNRFKRSPLPSLSPSPGGENPFEGSGKEIIVYQMAASGNGATSGPAAKMVLRS